MKTSKTHRRNAVLSMAIVLIIMAGAANAATTFFLWKNPVGQGPALGNPVWNLTPGESATIYIYCQADQRLIAVGIDLMSTNPAVAEGTASAILNPNFDVFDIPSLNTDRWQMVSNGTLGDLAAELNGTAIVEGSGLESDPNLTMWDPQYDQAAEAYLYATVDVIATGDLGTSTDLFLQVHGPSGPIVTPAVGTAGDVDIFFGAGETTPLNGDSFNIPSEFADGTINIVPEPATLSLLAIGMAALLRRRRH